MVNTKKKSIAAPIFFICLCLIPAPSHASFMKCDKADLSIDEVTRNSDLIIKGQRNLCDCGACMFSNQKINVLEIVKGDLGDKVITLNWSPELFDYGPSASDCLRVTNECMQTNGKQELLYLKKDRDGYKQTPTNGCNW